MDKNSDKSTFFSSKRIFDFNGKRMDFTAPRVMGILNVTPDSFYDWTIGRFDDLVDLMGKVDEMIGEGAYIIDIGAVSTRPGATEVGIEEEKSRIFPVLKEIRKTYPDLIISIDTFRSEVARMAAGEGADMINDISGGTFDPLMLSCITDLNIPYIIMHIQGTPANMQVNPVYHNVADEVKSFLLIQAKKLEEKGHNKIILDPGFGFGKTVNHNFQLLQGINNLVEKGYPIMAGLSRKSMINRVLGTKPAEALNGTTVLNTIALFKGTSILRVHDVREAVEAVKLVNKLISLPLH